MATIYFAGGCFWGTEEYFRQVHGVVETQVGYANGSMPSPTYEEVCTGETGHAETVRVEYDESIVSLRFLLELYFNAINPTVLNRQGPDEGTQYRTGIYYVNEKDKPIIDEALGDLQKRTEKPVVVEALPLKNFYTAEGYHQKYLEKRLGGYCHISREKMEKAKEARQRP